MANEVIPYATEAQLAGAVLGLGEVVFDITIGALRIGNGATAGGVVVGSAAVMAAIVAGELDPVVAAAGTARDEAAAARDQAVGSAAELRATRYAFEARDLAMVGRTYVVGRGRAIRSIISPGDAIAQVEAVAGRVDAADARIAAKPDTIFYEARDPALAGRVVSAGRGGAVRAIVPKGDVAKQIAAVERTAGAALAGRTYEARDLTVAGKLVVTGAAGAVRALLPAGDVPALLAGYDRRLLAALTGTTYETRDPAMAGKIVSVGRGGAIRSIVGSGPEGPAALAQLTALRGTTASPAARVAAVVTLDGAPAAHIIGKDRLRRTRNKLFRLDADVGPEPLIYSLVMPGDSYTQLAQRSSERVAKKLKARYGDAGAGWISFGFPAATGGPWALPAPQPASRNGNVSGSYYVAFTGAVTGTYYTTAFPDLASCTLTAAGDSVRANFPAGHPNVTNTLFFRARPGAIVKVSTDSGATWTQLALDGSVGSQRSGAYYTMPIGVPSPATTAFLVIEWVAGVCELGGCNAVGTRGVLVHKIAATGSRAGQWAAAAAGWEQMVAQLTPDCIHYMDGPNNQIAGIGAASWGQSVLAFFARCRAAAPAVDLLLLNQPENARGYAIRMVDLAREGRRLTTLIDCAYRDLQPLFGSADNVAEYASAGLLPMLNSDDLHPDILTGGPQLAAGSVEMLMPN